MQTPQTPSSPHTSIINHLRAGAERTLSPAPRGATTQPASPLKRGLEGKGAGLGEEQQLVGAAERPMLPSLPWSTALITRAPTKVAPNMQPVLQAGMSQDQGAPQGQPVSLPDVGAERTVAGGSYCRGYCVQASFEARHRFYFALGLPGCQRLQAVAGAPCVSPGPPWKLNSCLRGLLILHKK